MANGLNKEKQIFEVPTEDLFVSILIPFRNEEKNIETCLHSLSNVHYPHNLFEIILINDHSTDHSLKVIEHFQQKNSTLSVQIFHVQPYLQGKKEALEEGIKHAKGTIILTTDADCQFHKNWLSAMLQYFHQHQLKMLAAPVLFEEPASLFQQFLQIEQSSLILSSAGSLKNQFPLMVSGANLMFEKQAFYEVGGYQTHKNIASGDDVFLLHDFFKKYPHKVGYLLDEQVLVHTQFPKNCTEFMHQRVRWASKTKFYPLASKRIGFTIFLVNFFQLLCCFLCPFYPVFIGFIGVKFIVELFFIYKAKSLLNLRYTFVSFLFTFLMYPFYIVLIALLSLKKGYAWKNRQIST